MKLLFYDVETAQSKNMGSICAIGWLLVENEQEIERGYQLINPQCQFSRMNVSIHGITASDVKDAPCFADYWDSTLKALMQDSIVIAHNAHYDLAATEQALFNSGIKDPGIFYLDSLELFRFYFDLDSYKLESLASSIGYSYSTHNALEDAIALFRVMVHFRDVLGCADLASMIIKSPVRCENTLTNHYQPKVIARDPFPNKTRCKEDVEILNDIFAGKKVCITGDLPGFTRADLEKMILQNGGRPVTSVSSRTDYLLCCSRMDVPPQQYSTKLRTAIELHDSGEKIIILTPDEFFRLIDDNV